MFSQRGGVGAHRVVAGRRQKPLGAGFRACPPAAGRPAGAGLFDEPPPALRREHEIEGRGRLRMIGQEEVGILQVVRRLDLAGEQEVRRQRAVLRPGAAAVFTAAAQRIAAAGLPFSSVAAIVNSTGLPGAKAVPGAPASGQVQDLARLAEDEPLGNGNEIGRRRPDPRTR